MEPAPTIACCPACGAQLASTLLVCPACERLVHADELKRISQQAAAATTAGDAFTAMQLWRRALELLPPQSRQYQIISQKVAAISEQSPTPPPRSKSTTRSTAETRAKVWSAATGLGALALLLWKFKFILVFLATKGKLLLLGLTNASTLFSMFLSMGVYWAAWGWPFAIGLVLSIYVHEMGHIAALRKLGMATSAPMFIPGLGAMIRLRQHPVNAREDAYIGLAGPIWGLAAAMAAYAIFAITQAPIFAAIAHVGAWINLFNLLPIWQLDGGRGFRAFSRNERWIATAAIGTMWFITAEGLLVLLLIVAILRAATTPKDTPSNRAMLIQYVTLVIVLSLMCRIPVPMSAAQ